MHIEHTYDSYRMHNVGIELYSCMWFSGRTASNVTLTQESIVLLSLYKNTDFLNFSSLHNLRILPCMICICDDMISQLMDTFWNDRIISIHVCIDFSLFFLLSSDMSLAVKRFSYFLIWIRIFANLSFRYNYICETCSGE